MGPQMTCYKMGYRIDGGCRGNGRNDAIGAAVAIEILPHRKTVWTRTLPPEPIPTSQRAELTAIRFALELATRELKLQRCHFDCLDLSFYSDSKYAINCIAHWVERWKISEWVTTRGKPVENQDLIKKADCLREQVLSAGPCDCRILFQWVPRAKNQLADLYCDIFLEQQLACGGSMGGQSTEDRMETLLIS